MRLGLIRWVVGGVALAVIGFACSESSDEKGSSGAATSGNGGNGGAGDTGGTPATTGNGGDVPECPHMGDPVVDPESFPPCPNCMEGHCIPTSLIPPESADQLGDCDAMNKCVPDDLIASGGDFIPPTCMSIAGAEGRCLSECLPDIEAQAAQLPQDTCPAGQRCAPCYDPFTAMATGACTQSCDPGPTQPPVTFPVCCTNHGHCIPSELVPMDQQSQLAEDTCPMGQGFLCLPDGFADMTFVAQPCHTGTISLIFGSEYEPGACLPDCLPATNNFLIGQDDCAAGYKCAPCLEPPGGNPSGACDFLP
jgi:hypothetical protein